MNNNYNSIEVNQPLNMSHEEIKERKHKVILTFLHIFITVGFISILLTFISLSSIEIYKSKDLHKEKCEIIQSNIYPLPGKNYNYQIYSIYQYGDLFAAQEAFKSSDYDQVTRLANTTYSIGTFHKCFIKYNGHNNDGDYIVFDNDISGDITVVVLTSFCLFSIFFIYLCMFMIMYIKQ